MVSTFPYSSISFVSTNEGTLTFQGSHLNKIEILSDKIIHIINGSFIPVFNLRNVFNG